MFNIVEIFQIAICSFCKCVLQENLLSEKEFIKSLNYFIQYEYPLNECLESFSKEYTFDTGFIDNAVKEYELRLIKMNEESCKKCILETFNETINKLKTYDIGAFMHTLLKNINKSRG